MINSFKYKCVVCGEREFKTQNVLWSDLINEWELTPFEVDYINRQQGYHCVACGNNLRAMALAFAILGTFNFKGFLAQFIKSELAARINVLEINEAGKLTPFLQKLPNHQLIQYPQIDMCSMEFKPDSFDLIIHSDTLEHVSNPEKGLLECSRILRSGGNCIFTVPIIVDRMTRSRFGLRPSYHGQSGVSLEDQMVHTEFGADVWKTVIKSGFSSCVIYAIEYPSGLAISASKY